MIETSDWKNIAKLFAKMIAKSDGKKVIAKKWLKKKIETNDWNKWFIFSINSCTHSDCWKVIARRCLNKKDCKTDWNKWLNQVIEKSDLTYRKHDCKKMTAKRWLHTVIRKNIETGDWQSDPKNTTNKHSKKTATMKKWVADVMSSFLFQGKEGVQQWFQVPSFQFQKRQGHRCDSPTKTQQHNNTISQWKNCQHKSTPQKTPQRRTPQQHHSETHNQHHKTTPQQLSQPTRQKTPHRHTTEEKTKSQTQDKNRHQRKPPTKERTKTKTTQHPKHHIQKHKWFCTKSTNLICTSSRKWSRNVIEKKWYKKVIAKIGWKKWLKRCFEKVKNVVFDNGSNEVI